MISEYIWIKEGLLRIFVIYVMQEETSQPANASDTRGIYLIKRNRVAPIGIEANPEAIIPRVGRWSCVACLKMSSWYSGKCTWTAARKTCSPLSLSLISLPRKQNKDRSSACLWVNSFWRVLQNIKGIIYWIQIKILISVFPAFHLNDSVI